MKQASKKMAEAAAEVLNGHLAAGDDCGNAVKENHTIVELINEVLNVAAEGATLVAATEVDGTLLGFVPRASIPLPEKTKPPSPPKKSPAD